MLNLNISELFNKVDFLLDDNDLTFKHNEISYHDEPLIDIDNNKLTIYSTYNGYDKVIVDDENSLNYSAMLITQALNNIEASQEMKGSC